jgi:hypothetical protein
MKSASGRSGHTADLEFAGQLPFRYAYGMSAVEKANLLSTLNRTPARLAVTVAD